LLIRNRLFELYATTPTAPSAPKIVQQMPSAPNWDPIDRKDQRIEYRPSNRMPSNRTKPNRKLPVCLIAPTESAQNRPIRTIDHPAKRIRIN